MTSEEMNEMKYISSTRTWEVTEKWRGKKPKMGRQKQEFGQNLTLIIIMIDYQQKLGDGGWGLSAPHCTP